MAASLPKTIRDGIRHNYRGYDLGCESFLELLDNHVLPSAQRARNDLAARMAASRGVRIVQEAGGKSRRDTGILVVIVDNDRFHLEIRGDTVEKITDNHGRELGGVFARQPR